MTVWQAAALWEMDQLTRLPAGAGPDPVTVGDLTNAGWHACRAGQLAAAQLLAARGADLDWLGYDDLTSRQAGLASGNDGLIAWLQG